MGWPRFITQSAVWAGRRVSVCVCVYSMCMCVCLFVSGGPVHCSPAVPQLFRSSRPQPHLGFSGRWRRCVIPAAVQGNSRAYEVRTGSAWPQIRLVDARPRWATHPFARLLLSSICLHICFLTPLFDTCSVRLSVVSTPPRLFSGCCAEDHKYVSVISTGA